MRRSLASALCHPPSQPLQRRLASAAGPRAGPLHGIRVVEMAGLAAVPHVGMMLADFGAEVTRIDSSATAPHYGTTLLGRGKRVVALDLKAAAGHEAALRLAEEADVLVEGYRPGVMERLGLSPADLADRNPTLVYARVTGYGQASRAMSLTRH